MKLLSIITIIILFAAPHCFAPAFTITTPGIYELGENITFSPGGADSIISILVSNVTLDLGGRIIQQGNATAGVDGIALAPGLSNVTIRNGTIRNVTNRGIFVDSNGASSSQIVISDIVFNTCQSRGISFEDAGGNNFANDCVIKNCRLINCTSSGVSGDFVINCERCNRFVIKNIFMSGQGTSAPFTGLARAGIRLNRVVTSSVENIVITAFATNNTPFTGVSLELSSQVLVLKNILITDINTLSSAYTGISFNGSTAPQSVFTGIVGSNALAGTTASHITSNGTAISNCLFLDCMAEGITANGVVSVFDIGSGSDGNTFINCVAKFCTSSTTTCTGFNLSSVTTSSLIKCSAQRCNAGGSANCHGFLLTSCTRCQLIGCSGLGNTTNVGGTGTAFGLRLDTSTSCSLAGCIANNQFGPGAQGIAIIGDTSCTIDNCSSDKNIATISASIGFNLSGGSGNAFLRNVALINNTQYLGFAGTQTQSTASATPNAAFSPYTNVGLN